MSDNPTGWAELVAAPLGPAPPDDVPLAVLPCLGSERAAFRLPRRGEAPGL